MTFKVISNLEHIIEIQSSIKENCLVGLDTETTGLKVYTAKLLLLQLNIEGNIFIIDCTVLDKKYIKYILELLISSNVLFIGHNIKFDIKMLYHNLGVLLTNVYDTMVIESLIYAGLSRTFYFSLEDLIQEYFDIKLDKEIRKTFIEFNGIFTQEQLNYAASDVVFLIELREKQLSYIFEKQSKEVVELEIGLVPVFAKMEYDGITLDKDAWLEVESQNIISRNEVKLKILNLFISNIKFSNFKNLYELAIGFKIPVKTKKLINELSGVSAEHGLGWFREMFDLDSPYQIKAMLNYMGVPVPNTNEKTIDKFRKYDIINLVLEYREYQKRISTYGSAFLRHINSITGRIHTEFDQVKSTGRIGSSQPNLQNQPKLEMFRKCYIARPGYKFYTADYSQLELRLIAEIGREIEMISAFKLGQDLHKKTATILYDKLIEEINRSERSRGKSLNFAINYGSTEYGLYVNFGIPIEEGREHLKKFFSGYKYLKSFIKLAGDQVIKLGYSITPLGRKRFFKDRSLFKDAYERERYIATTKREGVNHIIQGCAADVVKLAMLNIFRNNPFGEDLKILLQVHDELVIEFKDGLDKEVKEFVDREMIFALQKFLNDVPAMVDGKIDTCWSKE